ncbi:hypothetical protein B0T16DRAFT_36194 [Cercophora newfieldiana]|uniref:Uncharacterized protein n=1 Tax=Cercophora newfieldiana TaxID=92897 RepID=A0AA40D130_9PEZI|nr:hypothetical protein B0T16DRAFT_36194 [Cercophora newfieldiana]
MHLSLPSLNWRDSRLCLFTHCSALVLDYLSWSWADDTGNTFWSIGWERSLVTNRRLFCFRVDHVSEAFWNLPGRDTWGVLDWQGLGREEKRVIS